LALSLVLLVLLGILSLSLTGCFSCIIQEVIQGEDYDTKADIWSTGVMCIEMIDGLPPYMDYPPLKALYQIVSYGLPPPENEAMMSAEFKDFLQCCTIFEHEDRPGCAELLKVRACSHSLD